MDDHSELAELGQDQAEDRSLSDDLRELAGNARSYAAAELAYQKARAAYAASHVKGLALLGLLALALAFFALMALVVGTVIALGTALGPWRATAVVTGTLVILVLVCLLLIRARLARMKAVLDDKDMKP